MSKKLVDFITILLTTIPTLSGAAGMTVDMYHISHEGTETKIGVMKIEDTPYGTLFSPNMSGLKPGLHGFHVHAIGDCRPLEKNGRMVAGLAAGGHYDPGKTKAHKGPYGNGHLGDLPALYVDASGTAVHPVLAPRLTPADLADRSLVVKGGGDNYAEAPKPEGGGGARVACGVVGKGFPH